MARTKSDTKLQRILDAAAEAFIETGYRGTRLDEIARRAGLSAGTIYLYAEGKESLFQLVLRRALGDPGPSTGELPFRGVPASDLIEWVWGRFNEIARFPCLEAAARAPAPPADARAEFELVLREIWGWQARYWQALELIERCARDWPELHLLFYREFRRRVFETATRLVERRMDEGVFRRYPDAATAVRVASETITFFAMHRHVRPDTAELDEATCRETVIAMLLAGFDPAHDPVPDPRVAEGG